ncbi:LLM class flavin-dependent oxidoreductase [Micromonospora sp. FIMYZ51]|uniref:LLM class flavin-dependent oxidoreductase n=1 Tax=Micromonospora sp. FIMYZ51 TaxID=3051832 RepID=UPI00311EAE74
MAVHLHWFLPSHSDGRAIARVEGEIAQGSALGARRDPDLGYLTQVAQAADRLGFESVLVPFGLFCEDPWLVTAALAQQTRRLKFMIALRPGLISPTLVAQLCASTQRLTGNRLLLNVVTGGDSDEQRRYGDWADHGSRYERTGELLTILNGTWDGCAFDFEGEHYRVKAARVMRPSPRPAVFVGGSSPAAQQVAARHADTYLAWGETPEQLRALVADFRARTAAYGRTVPVGTRFHVISRDTAAEAWAVAERMLAGMDPAMVAAAQSRFALSESEGQRRMAALHAANPGRLEVAPNIWVGYSLLRPGAGAALVGSHTEVADRIEELHGLGIDHLILSGQPHLEEAYWFGEGVLPILAARGLLPDG